MYLVLLETAGNQSYIFDSNRLAENAGASELTRRAGCEYVLAAVERLRGVPPGHLCDRDPGTLARNLCSPSRNPPIESGSPIEVLLATSGKALVLVRDLEMAKALIEDVTLAAAREAPGLDLAGALCSAEEMGSGGLGRAIDEVHRRLEDVRSALPATETRFLRLPVVRDCAASALPAERLVQRADGREAVSAVSLAKRMAGDDVPKRMAGLFGDKGRLLQDSVAALERRLEGQQGAPGWVAVVHADGNGLGAVFQGFAAHARAFAQSGDRGLADSYRRFSLALEECTLMAFGDALGVMPSEDGAGLPVLPLVLGGDDLTVMCDGRFGLAFAAAYLRAFEHHSVEAGGGIVSTILHAATGTGRATACAGVAITKGHYPFHAAYDLAEDLLRSAKQVLRRVTGASGAIPCSALDFHVLYDASQVRLDDARSHLKLRDGPTRLYARPYVVSEDVHGRADPASRDWLAQHDWDSFIEAVAALEARDSAHEGAAAAVRESPVPRRVPSRQAHALREALFRGREAADAVLHGLLARGAEDGLDALLAPSVAGSRRSLFWWDRRDQTWATRLLDALEAFGVQSRLVDPPAAPGRDRGSAS